MKYSLLGWSLLVCLPATHAQSSAADPAIAVPAVRYRSVFADMPKGVETDALDWKAANAEVGQFVRGHIDILKWEAAQDKAKAAKPAMPMPHGSGTGQMKP